MTAQKIRNWEFAINVCFVLPGNTGYHRFRESEALDVSVAHAKGVYYWEERAEVYEKSTVSDPAQIGKKLVAKMTQGPGSDPRAPEASPRCWLGN